MSTINVLLVGVGLFGDCLAEALLTKSNVKLRILARNDDPKYVKYTSRGAELVFGTLTDSASLEKACQGIHTVISAINSVLPPDMIGGQLNLLHAAEKAGCQRFVPSDLSLNFHALDYGENVNLDIRKKVYEEVQKSTIGSISFLIGCFMDILFSQRINLFVFKDGTFTANEWGDGNVPLQATTREDAAKYLAEVVLDPEIPKKAIVSVAGDSKTFNEIVKIIQNAGLPVDVKPQGAVDDLKEEITRRKQANPQNYPSYVPLQYILPMVSGKGIMHDVISNKYKNIKPTTIADYITKEYVKK